MEIIFLMVLSFLGGLLEAEAVSQTGVQGGQITITCSHKNAQNNEKYFCKGACRDEDILIRSRDKKSDSNGKYSIRDEGNTFYVTITQLTAQDSGNYRCGINRLGLDTYNEVVIRVIEGDVKEPDVEATDSPSMANENSGQQMPSSKKLVYIGAGLGAVVLALAVVLLIFFRHGSRGMSASSGKEHCPIYATPMCHKHAQHMTTSSSAANEDPVADDRPNHISSVSSIQHHDADRHCVDNIYSNITVPSTTQTRSDSIFYSTVSFNKHTDCSTVTPATAAVTYSTLNYRPTDESTLYCDV